MHRLLDEGLPIAEVARRLGRSRQTIYNWKKAGDEPRKTARRTSKLDPYRAYLASRLERYDLPATVLLRELRERGYEGGISILRDAVARIKDREVRRLVDRFETEPGRQAQIDWASCGTIEHRGRRRRLSLFVLVLGYSRVIWARFVVSERRPQLCELLERAFRDLGGVPRELVVDNMRQIIQCPRTPDSPAVVQPGFAEFAAHWGFDVVACPPYWPRAKGKVERAVDYLKRSFLEGRAFSDLDELNAQLAQWLATVANVRVHGTTGQRPVDRLEAERGALLPLAGMTAWPRLVRTTRRVDIDARISFEGVRYSVDPRIVRGRHVEVVVSRTTDEQLRIEHDGQLVGLHPIAPAGSPPRDDPRHAALRRALRARPPRERPAPRAPRFDQQQHEIAPRLGPAPTVEERDLAVYDREVVR